jgi:transcriptional regulator with XRE-family HTH domain
VNVDRRPEERLDPAVWQRHEMRMALAARDIAAVFRLLQRVGVSQRRIASLTGQSQSEISEILGGRQVMAYDVLARIADGLGVPRGHLGLAYDPTTAALVESAPAEVSSDDENEDPRRMLARVAQVTVGAVALDPESWWQPFERSTAPVPTNVGLADVLRLENITEEFRALDHQYGGGACRDAVVAQAQSAQQMLRATIADDVGPRLHTALADLHLLAGWTSFDVGLYAPARRHFARALEQARYAEEPSLVAKVLNCMGRLHLHQGLTVEALRLFQLGQIAAQESGCPLAVAVVTANEAWAYSLLGDVAQALAAVTRAKAEFAKGDPWHDPPPWIRFFGSADLQGLIASTYASLPDPTPQQRAIAIEGFYVSTALRELSMTRSRAFDMTTLAFCLFEAGHLDEAVKIGQEAVELAEQVRSLRVIDRFAPLRASAARHATRSDARDLVERIDKLRG